MERSAYRRTHSARRRSYGARTSQQRRRSSPLLICLGLLIFAVAINYLFPHFSKAVGDKVSTYIDYRAAFAAIGEGLTGERKLTEAFGDAWTLAFRGSSGDTQETFANASPEVAAPPQATENAATEDTATEDAATEDAATEDTHGGTLSDAVIAAFTESQREYPEYMTPSGAGYGIY